MLKKPAAGAAGGYQREARDFFFAFSCLILVFSLSNCCTSKSVISKSYQLPVLFNLHGILSAIQEYLFNKCHFVTNTKYIIKLVFVTRRGKCYITLVVSNNWENNWEKIFYTNNVQSTKKLKHFPPLFMKQLCIRTYSCK